MTHLSPGPVNSGMEALIEIQKLSAGYLAHREQNFRKWILATDPNHPKKLNKIPVGFLKEIYPNLWRYGPNGEVFTYQIDAIHAHLDSQQTANTGFTHHFNAAFTDWIGSPTLDTVNRELRYYATKHGTPLPEDDLIHNNPADNIPTKTRAEQLLDHPYWHGDPQGRHAFEISLNAFAHLTIHHDMLFILRHHYPDLKTTMGNYDDLCTRWDIPA